MRCMGEGGSNATWYRSLNSHAGPTTAAFSASQRRRSSRSAVTTRQFSPLAMTSATTPTIASSPEAGADTTRTGSASARLAPRPPRRYPARSRRGVRGGRRRVPQPLGGVAGAALEDEHPGAARARRSCARPARSPHGTGAARHPPGRATSRRPGRPSRWPRRPRPWQFCALFDAGSAPYVPRTSLCSSPRKLAAWQTRGLPRNSCTCGSAGPGRSSSSLT